MEAEKRQESSNRGFKGVYTMPEGYKKYIFSKDATSAKFDILPFIMETENGPEAVPHFSYHIHNNMETWVICLEAQFGKPCPICEAARALPRGEAEQWKKLRAQKRQLYYVIPRDGNPELKGKVAILEQADYSFGSKLETRVRERDKTDPSEKNWHLYADPLKGYTVKVLLKEKQLAGRNPYMAVEQVDFKTRIGDDGKPYQLTYEMCDVLPDLSKTFTVLSYDELKKMFDATPEKTDEEEPAPFDPANGYNPIVKTASKPATRPPVEPEEPPMAESEDDDEPPSAYSTPVESDDDEW